MMGGVLEASIGSSRVGLNQPTNAESGVPLGEELRSRKGEVSYTAHRRGDLVSKPFGVALTV